MFFSLCQRNDRCLSLYESSSNFYVKVKYSYHDMYSINFTRFINKDVKLKTESKYKSDRNYDC